MTCVYFEHAEVSIPTMAQQGVNIVLASDQQTTHHTRMQIVIIIEMSN